MNDMFSVDPFSLRGRHVVITGGGRGLGQAIVLAAARAGAEVSLVARSGEQLDDVRRQVEEMGGSCRTWVRDLSLVDEMDDFGAALWDHRPVTGLVHAAGIQLRKPAVHVTVEEWRRVQATNLDAPYFLSTAVARRQIESETPGSHVFVGSLNSSIGLPNISPYVASKTALVGVARAFSTEWARHNVRANVIGPGYFKTAMTEGLLANPEDERRIMGRIPMGQLGLPEDVGSVAAFLLSDASRYVTGQLINVDGGWLAS